MSTDERWMHHEDSGARCSVPPGWSSLAIAGAGVAAVEPARGRRFQASLVLTVVDNGGLTFAQWQARTDRMLPLVLDDYELVDLRHCRFAGHPGGQRLSRHRAADGRLLMLHQWFCAPDGVGVTLTSTCDVPSYARIDALAHRCAARLQLAGQSPDPLAPSPPAISRVPGRPSVPCVPPAPA